MKTSYARFLSTFTLILNLFSFAFADSSSFSLVLDASGTTLDGKYLVLGDDLRFYIGSTDSPITAKILTNTTLEINGYATGIGKNYLSLIPYSTSWIVADPWTVVDGYLKLYGSNFHAVPDGETDGRYVLGSINAAATRTDMIPVKVKADGVTNYPSSDSSSAASSGSSSTAETSKVESSTTESKASTSAAVSSSVTTLASSTAASTSAPASSATSAVDSSVSTSAAVTSTGSASENAVSSSVVNSSNISSSEAVPTVATYTNGAARMGTGFAAILLSVFALV